MKKTGKSILTLVILLVVLGGLIAGYLILTHYNSIEEEEDPSILLLDKTDKVVTSLQYNDGDKDLSFVYENDVWEYALDSHFPLQQKPLQDMATAASSIEAKLQVDTSDAEEETYGLDTPASTVEVTFTDGSIYTYTFGDTNSFNGYQYFTISGDDAIYMVEASLAKSFGTPLHSLYEAESYALTEEGVEKGDVTSILLETASGSAKEITDASGIETLFAHVDKLNLSSWEDYYADTEEMQEVYGIHAGGDRITVTYNTEDGESATYTVYIGNKFERVDEDTDEAETASDDTEGKTAYEYFYSPQGSTVVYTADADTIDAIFNYLVYTPPVDTTDPDAE